MSSTITPATTASTTGTSGTGKEGGREGDVGRMCKRVWAWEGGREEGL